MGQGFCYDFLQGSSLCTHDQTRSACSLGNFVILAGGRWLRDRGGDDTAMIVKLTDCDNFDGLAADWSAQGGAYCCLEWMKY